MKLYLLVQQLEDVPADNHWLSARELAALDKLNIPKRRDDWRLGRWTAKRVAAHCLGPGDDLAKVEIFAEHPAKQSPEQGIGAFSKYMP